MVKHFSRNENAARDAAILVKILKRLSSLERNALLRLYVDGETKESIGAALGFDERTFRALRLSTKAAFFQETGQKC
jgi:DNA-directed RNA polymerase specialized sigma24 family protein